MRTIVGRRERLKEVIVEIIFTIEIAAVELVDVGEGWIERQHDNFL